MQRIQCRRLEDSPLNPDQVANLLRRAIREGVRRPGDELIQDELARRLGVSRIPLREAFRTLAAEGLITIRPWTRRNSDQARSDGGHRVVQPEAGP